jgi:hypothetical protein
MQAPLTRAHRPDLDTAEGMYGMRTAPLDWHYSSNCTASIKVSRYACDVQQSCMSLHVHHKV